MPKKVLIITSAAGGGHLQAAKAKRKELELRKPKSIIYEKDLMIDFVNRHFGIYILGKWNEAQRLGNVSRQELMLKAQPLSDRLFWLFFFIGTSITLLRYDIDRIIDTQPMGTSAILQAVKFVQWLTKKKIGLEKVITELPTDKVTHFFKPIKGLSSKKRSMIRLISSPPLLKKDQTAEGFWQENCGLSENDVTYDSLPLRPYFAMYQDKKRSPLFLKLKIQVFSYDERQLIEQCIKKGSAKYRRKNQYLEIDIRSQDKVAIVMIGSKPNEKATLCYVSNFINILNNLNDPKRNDLLFVFCGNTTDGKNALLAKVHQLTQTSMLYPKNLTIIPMSHQEDDVVAPLFFRSNATFTKSGGLTSMELLTLCDGHIWIHAEINKSQKHIPTMPHWEEGNACYLKEKKGAEFITPDDFSSRCQAYFT